MGKKKPAKTNETAANLPPINIEGVQMDLPISQLCRHPDNREPSESSVDEIAASIAQHGLLEPLTVRQIDESLYEIISGETRSLAARKLGHLVIRCKVIEADDAKALQLVAIANGLREDLNPIQQAKLIERLCDPVSNGGGGMTRADAALAVGLESASAASNAVGLLRLPEIWQQRIASGKLPATFGRTMLPACEVPAVFGSLEEAWDLFEEAQAENDEYELESNDFSNRSSLERSVEQLLEKHTRPCDKQTHWYSNLGLMYNQADQPMLFKLTPELEKSLDVKTIRIGGEDRLVATNVEAYEALQIPLIQKKAKGKNAPVADDDGEKRPLTPAELKIKKKEAAEKLAKRINTWRDRWLQRIISDSITIADDFMPTGGLSIRLAVWAAAHLEQRIILNAIGNLAPTRSRTSSFGISLDQVISIEPNDACAMANRVMAVAVLANEAWPTEVLEQAMRWLGNDLAERWAFLQTAVSEPHKELLSDFYNLFTTDQLEDLAKELKEPEVARVTGKQAKINVLKGGFYVTLPKVIKRIEQPKAKVKKGA